jgi:hypothetical protein
MNAAREAVSSWDIEAIVRQEVAPVRPDLVVYYEGVNQFEPGNIVKNLAAATPPHPGLAPDGIVARSLRIGSQHLALIRRIQALVGSFELPEGGREWPKPDYEVTWPLGLDEFDPDLGRSDVPVNLSVILPDLDRIRADLAKVDGELALSSVMWLVKDGMLLDPIRGRIIWEYLNIYRFPFRYRDMERLTAFQNRVFAKYAATHGLPFIDVAGRMPFDPNLFADAVHTTYPGARLKAWVVLQQLVPIIEKRLASGSWPKPAPVMGDTHPAFAKDRGRSRSTASRDDLSDRSHDATAPSRRRWPGRREFTDEKPSHYRHRRARCRRCVFGGSEKCRSAGLCAGKDRCCYDGAHRQWHDDPAYADVRPGGAQQLRPASPCASLAIEGDAVQADLAVSRFVAVREWHDWPMRQSPVIVGECLSRAGSLADEMSCRFRDCNPGAERRLPTSSKALTGPAKFARRCAAAGQVLIPIRRTSL